MLMFLALAHLVRVRPSLAINFFYVRDESTEST